MKIKSILFAISLVNLSFTAFANVDKSPNVDLADKIKSELAEVDINYAKLDGEVLKIRFMINEKKEILVLSTNNKTLDSSIKSALNYDKIETEELKPFEVYIVPIKFESK